MQGIHTKSPRERNLYFLTPFIGCRGELRMKRLESDHKEIREHRRNMTLGGCNKMLIYEILNPSLLSLAPFLTRARGRNKI
jgi:hypothetical protein